MATHPGEDLSPETKWLVQNELATLDHGYATGDVLNVPARCLVGFEMDYYINHRDMSEDAHQVLEASRDSMVLELSLLAPKNEEQAARKARWLEQIPELTPAELINYQIYRRLSAATLDSPETKMYFEADDSPETTLEFVFGNGLYQTGYYDNPGVFEMRTQAARPAIAAERRKRALAVGREVAEEFGAEFYHLDEGTHTNFSVWVPEQGKLQPLHTLDNQEGHEAARKGAAGIICAIKDSLPVIMPPYDYSPGKTDRWSFHAHHAREGFLRVVPDHFEQRLSVREQYHDLNVLALMSGFAHGVNNEVDDDRFVRVDYGTLLTAGDGYDKSRDLYLLRSLQQSLQQDGSFLFPDKAELHEGRADGMLSSLIGTEAHATDDVSHVLRALISAITLTSGGVLEVNEEAFIRAVRDMSPYFVLNGTAKDTIGERLRRIRVLPGSAMVMGGLECEYPSGVKYHGDLAKYPQAPSLKYIGRHVLEVVGCEYAGRFTHEEAVYSHIDQKIIATSGLSTSEKVAQIQTTLDQFSNANPDVVRNRILHELELDIDRLKRSAQAALDPKTPAMHPFADGYMRRSRSQRDLYNTLLDAVPPMGYNGFRN